MWQVAVAAAVAGSGLIAKHIFSPNPLFSSSSSIQTEPNNQQQQEESQLLETPNQFTETQFLNSQNDGSIITSNGEETHELFRFSSFGSRSSSKKPRNLAKKIRVAHKKVGCFDDYNGSVCQKKKVTVCLKRRKTCRNGSGNNRNSSLSKDCSSFGWGLGLGMICMMSAGKAEINKLSCTIDETAKVVSELKSELNKQNSVPCHQLLSFGDSGNTVDIIQKPMAVQANNDSCSLSKHPIDTKLFRHLADSDYASSVLTEEHQHEAAEMDQLEAELESELQKLPWCTTETSKHKENSQLWQMKRKTENRSSASYHSDGVHSAELRNKLSMLLIEQQESHISELESELNSAHSKLQQKEAELQTLKECVRRLTEFSFSAISDEETTIHREESGVLDRNTVGTKRAMHFS